MAIDGLTVVVNPENDFGQCLTSSQLKKVWDQGSTVSTSGTISTQRSRTEDIELFSPGADSGTFDYFTEEVNGKVDQSRNDGA